MKRNMKFFAIVISLLVLSTIVLTGCMLAIAADNGEMKPYDLNGNLGSNIVEEAPLSQMEMNKKFSQYLQKDGNTVTVFSEEQYAELKAVRENGKRNPLTYDEILYLINDSINLYFSYDKIRLTNAVVDGISHKLYLSSNAEIIYSYHGDYSEFKTYDAAEEQYEKVLEDIYSVIYYRIYVHDAGFEKVTEYFDLEGKDTVVFADDLEENEIDKYILRYRMQLLSLNNSNASGDVNKKHLVNEWENIVKIRNCFESNLYYEVDAELKAPLLAVCHYSQADVEPLYQISIVDYTTFHNRSIIYPTAELKGMKPQQIGLYEANVKNNEPQPAFYLNYPDSGKVTMSAHTAFSSAIIGKYAEHDGVLKMYFGEYSYVFYKYEKGYVYSAENSKPAIGFNFTDGLVFEKDREFWRN